MIIIKVVFHYVRDKLCCHCFIFEGYPVKILEPWMFFYFLRSIYPESFRRLPHQTSIYEIGCFFRVSFGKVFFANVCLSAVYCVSYFFPAFSLVWSSPQHTFISYNSNSKIICCNSMILLKHNLRGHISRSTRAFITIFRLPYSGDSKISKSQISI